MESQHLWRLSEKGEKMIPEIIILISGFLAGLVVTNIDFGYWWEKTSDKWWYFYFIHLYIFSMISVFLATIGTFYSPAPLSNILLLLFGGVLLGYAPTGILYSAYDLARKPESGKVWLAPSLYCSYFKWYIIHLIILMVGGFLVFAGG